LAPILFLIFIIMPLAEIAVLVKVGGLIGLWPTLAVVILTAMAGTWLLRLQGFQTWQRAQAALQRGEAPVAEVLDGMFLFAAALLMVTPGLITDTMGFLFLIPPVRHAVAKGLVSWAIRTGRLQVYPGADGGMTGGMAGGMGRRPDGDGRPERGGTQPGPGRKPDGVVIEGEAVEISNDEPDGKGPSDPDSPWKQ